MLRAKSISTMETVEAVKSMRFSARTETSLRRRRRDSGAILLAVLFMMAMMVIVAMAMAPSFVQQMKRDREEEMIHRGTEYARAIRKFYKKFGRYPANLEQLEDTNQIRFLRRRYKDPMSKNGEWKLIRSTDVPGLVGGPPVIGAPGVQLGPQGGLPASTLPQSAGASASGQSANTAPAGVQLLPQQQVTGPVAQTLNSEQTGGAASPLISEGTGNTGQSGPDTGSAAGQNNNPNGGRTAGTQDQTGNNNTIFGNTGVGGQTFGGGAVVGVASKDKETTIRVFNKKKTYDEWQFIYNPMMDRVNVLLRGPYNGQSFGGTQVGIPAGQLNQVNPGASGQQPGGVTQQPGGFGQQNPQQYQQNTPGGQFPPDQNQPQ